MKTSAAIVCVIVLAIGCPAFCHNTHFDDVLRSPCGHTRIHSTYTLETLVTRTQLFSDIINAVKIGDSFLEREGLPVLLGNAQDCGTLDVPVRLNKTSKLMRTLLNFYGDLSIYARAMNVVEERENEWMTNKRIMPVTSLNGEIRHYVKTNMFGIMCAVNNIIRRPMKIRGVVMRTSRDFRLPVMPVCSLFQTVTMVTSFENYLTSSAELLRQSLQERRQRQNQQF